MKLANEVLVEDKSLRDGHAGTCLLGTIDTSASFEGTTECLRRGPFTTDAAENLVNRFSCSGYYAVGVGLLVLKQENFSPWASRESLEMGGSSMVARLLGGSTARPWR